MIVTMVSMMLPVVLTVAFGVLAGWHHDENMRAADAFGRMLLVYALPLSLFTSTAVLPLDILLDYWPLVVVLLGATL